MHVFWGFMAICLSLFIIKNRESLGNTIGEAEWMQKIGGIYYVLVYCAIMLFVGGFTVMFGLQNQIVALVLAPIMPYLFGGGGPVQ